jgi:hypothetical protein
MLWVFTCYSFFYQRYSFGLLHDSDVQLKLIGR